MKYFFLFFLFNVFSCHSNEDIKEELYHGMIKSIKVRDSINNKIFHAEDSLFRDTILINDIDFVMRLSKNKTEVEGLTLQIHTIRGLLDSLEKR